MNKKAEEPVTTEQPAPVKAKRGKLAVQVLIAFVAIVALAAIGAYLGYLNGIGIRVAARSAQVSPQLIQQLQYALEDQQFGRYEDAKVRLEWILKEDPSFPGIQAELTKVLVSLQIPTATPTVVPTPTVDMRGIQDLYATTQGLVAKGEWASALAALDQLRKMNPGYEAAAVDGYYYYVLRNLGVYKIQNSGDLEGGMYDLTLAEHFAPLDSTASIMREGANAYIQASAYFGSNWQMAVQQFSSVAAGWPAMWDGTMNATMRYKVALMRYGDQLAAENKSCDAVKQYQLAMQIGPLDAASQKLYGKAQNECFPPTEVMPIETLPVDFTPEPSATPTP